MRLFLTFFIVLLVLNSCKPNEQNKPSTEALIMVEQSEMALLMNQMYAYNESIRYYINKGDLQEEFPEFFNKILTAQLTDPSDRNEEFTEDALQFITTQKTLHSNSNMDLKLRYNNAVNACISCHQQTCIGPIPRIEKLFIK